jgi:hypothetical protein
VNDGIPAAGYRISREAAKILMRVAVKKSQKMERNL